MPIVRVTLDIDIPDESSFRAALHFSDWLSRVHPDRKPWNLDLLDCTRRYADVVVAGALDDDLADAGANVVGSDAVYVKQPRKEA